MRFKHSGSETGPLLNRKPSSTVQGGIEVRIRERLEGLPRVMSDLLSDGRIARARLKAAASFWTPYIPASGPRGNSRTRSCLVPLILSALLAVPGLGQDSAPTRRIRGTVSIEPSGVPARDAAVTIVGLKRSVFTDENGRFEFSGIPEGEYEVIAHVDRVPDAVKAVEVTGSDQILDFQLTMSTVRSSVTVTATGSTEATGSSYHSVDSIGNLELAQRNPISIGEALQYQLGVANRGFGPGAGRPVIRGFDGDRVLVLQDGLRVGGIAAASGDEVEPMDILSLDRVEVVKGPATLLYGSNAMGGVVNGVSTNSVYRRSPGGYLTTFGGTNNWQKGGSGGLQLGARDFQFFASGGAQTANDYHTPLGSVLNSYASNEDVTPGVGWYLRKGWLVFTYGYDRRRHGIPVEPGEVDFESLKERRHAWQVRGGLRGLGGFIEGGDFAVSYNDYKALEYEFESDENVTELDALATNKNFNYRVNFNHRRLGRFSGTFGSSGFTRDFFSTGAEAPAPRTRQHSFAAYGLERLDFERVGLQFGARVEQYSYNPAGNFRARDFVGFAGSVGVRVPLWQNGLFVANYQRSFRAPALEELYNNGPHPGLLVFDIGNQNLAAEHGNSIELSLRHNAGRVRLEANVYYYRLGNFVFPAFVGRTDGGSGLPIVNYSQGGSRYRGAEAAVEARVSSTVSFDAKVDYVQANLIQSGKGLPRIPPLRATLGFDWRYKAFSVRPELRLANQQGRVYDNETPTAGYAFFNLSGSYTLVRGRTAHTVTLTGFNLGDALYRNHLSLLKSVAPEIGRGVRLVYTARF